MTQTSPPPLEPASQQRRFSLLAWGHARLSDLAWSSFVMGLLAAFVGTASSFSVVMQGLEAVGATPAQVASGLMALSVSKGAVAIALSLGLRTPYSLAWSTSGAALLVATGPLAGGFGEAVGAFIVCALLLMLTGFLRPLARLIAAIPSMLAHAMLAGVLLPLCLAPFKTLSLYPLWGLILLLAWLFGRQINSLLAVPAALLAFAGILAFGLSPDWASLWSADSGLMTAPVWVSPQLSMTAVASLALPLYLVTMAGQNLPGQAALRLGGFDRPHDLALAGSGLAGLIASVFGGHANSLAAITASLCAGSDAHPQPSKRYWSAVWAGVFYILFGLFAGLFTRFIALAPTLLIQTVAGLALLSTFSSSLLAAFQASDSRIAAAITFLMTASGVSIFGVSGAFWGLIAGGLVLALQNTRWRNTTGT